MAINETARISKDCKMGENVTVMKDVEIGKEVKIGNNVVIYPNVKIGKGVEIQDNSVIGKMPRKATTSSRDLGDLSSHTIIGDNTFVGTLVTIYATTRIGEKCLVGDLASIREGCVIGNSTIIGSAVTVNYNTSIGNFTKIQTGSHITGNMIIEDHVFFGPLVTSMNDKYMDRAEETFKGPHVKRGARIGGNATLLPGITIGEEAVIGAGAVVTKDVGPYTVAVGVPAKPIKEVPKEQYLDK